MRDITEQALRESIAERLTIRQIALRFGCSYTNVRYWLKKLGIKTLHGPHCRRFDGAHLCGRCGEIDPAKFYGRKMSICGRCQNQYVIDKGREKRDFALDLLGAKCVKCGYASFRCSLQIHHKDPRHKDVGFKSMRGWSFARIEREMRGCVVLCGNCHPAVHAVFLSL